MGPVSLVCRVHIRQLYGVQHVDILHSILACYTCVKFENLIVNYPLAPLSSMSIDLQ